MSFAPPDGLRSGHSEGQCPDRAGGGTRLVPPRYTGIAGRGVQGGIANFSFVPRSEIGYSLLLVTFIHSMTAGSHENEAPDKTRTRGPSMQGIGLRIVYAASPFQGAEPDCPGKAKCRPSL